ncbi:MAG: hypothetical protein IPK85_02235 [Gemmatimonadetes bacterium]|nr:hypothetical protein [Gemmatimonadota bacterium]
MSEFERKDDLPKGSDSVPIGSDSDDTGGDFEIVVSDTPPEPEKPPVEGDDGVPGGDDAAEPSDAEDAQEEPRGPKSRSARVRERLRQERDQAIAAAHALHQHNQQLAHERQTLAMARAQLEAQAVENRFMYLQAVQQQLTVEKRRAMDEGRSDDISRIDTTMMQLGPELHQIAQRRAMMQQQRPQMPQQPMMPPPQMRQPMQPPPRLHPNAQKWADAHSDWLDERPERLADARAIAQRLESQGFTPDDPEYIERINAGLRAIHPDFRPVNPVRPGGAPRAAGFAVAGVSRPSASSPRQTRQITLTAEDMIFCERHGINPKSYAREKQASGAGR